MPMSPVKTITTLLAAALAASALPASAQSLIVRASGPSASLYRAGTRLADTARLTLKQGDIVTLLDSRGTRTVRGPGIFSVITTASADTIRPAQLSSLMNTQKARRARTGAVRGTGADAAPRNPSIWFADIGQSSDFCVADPAAVQLWRADSSVAASYAVTQGTASATVSFAAGQATAPWPVRLPVSDGGDYRLSGGGLPQPVSLRFRLLPQAPEDMDAIAALLIENKCEAQLSLLIETTAQPEPAAAR